MKFMTALVGAQVDWDQFLELGKDALVPDDEEKWLQIAHHSNPRSSSSGEA